MLERQPEARRELELGRAPATAEREMPGHAVQFGAGTELAARRVDGLPQVDVAGEQDSPRVVAHADTEPRAERRVR